MGNPGLNDLQEDRSHDLYILSQVSDNSFRPARQNMTGSSPVGFEKGEEHAFR